MKKNLYKMSKINCRKILCVIFLLFLACTGLQSQTYSVVDLNSSGFNEDVVAESSPAASSTTTTFDTYGTVFYQAGFPGGSYGLPVSRSITSPSGPVYTLRPYNGDNILLLTSANTSGTLTLTTPGTFKNISILATSGQSYSSFSVILRFSDGTTQSYTFCVPDWYVPGTSCNPVPSVAAYGFDRVMRSTNVCDNNGSAPNLYDCMISLNTSDQVKLLNSIAFSRISGSGGRAGIFGVCGVTAANAPFAPVADAATSITINSFQANWHASAGPTPTGYYLDVSSSSSFSPNLSSYNNLNVGNVTTYGINGLSSGNTYYYRVRAANANGVSVSSNTITQGTLSPPSDPTSISVTVNPICTGSSTKLTANGVVGTVYWYTENCGVTYLTTGNSITVSPSSNTNYYARNYNNSLFSPGCASATITVNPVSVGGSIAGSATVCSGTNSTHLTLSGYTGSIVKWQKSTDNWVTPQDINNTFNNYSATNLTATTKYRAVVQSGVCASVYSSDATVTVDPVSVGGSVGGASSVCSGTNSTLLTLSTYTGTILKWQKSTDNWVTPEDIANTNNNYTATNLTATTKYRAVVQSGVCSSAYSSDATVTVSPVTEGGSISGPASVCSGPNSTLLTLSGYTGTILKWQKSTDNWVTPVDISNTSNIYTATNLITTTKYRALVQSGVCASQYSSDATITVNTPLSPPVLVNATYYQNVIATPLDATIPGAISYSWSNGSTVVSTSAIYIPPTDVIGSVTYTVTITAPTGCTNVFASATITVTPTPHMYFFMNTLGEVNGNGPTLTQNLSASCSPTPAGGSYITDNLCASATTVFAFNRYAGLNYPNPNLVTSTYTINVYWKFSTYGGGYARIIDFSNSTSDAGIYCLGNQLNFFPNGNIGGAGLFVDGNYYLLSMVRDGSTNMIKVYINGVFLSSYNDASNTYKLATNTTPLIFFRDDNPVPCEARDGRVKYISIINTTSTDAQITSVYTSICNTITNTPPTITEISDQTVIINNPTSALPFTIGDNETPAGSLSLTGSSDNTTLVPEANIVFTGSGTNRFVTVTPATGQSGTADITVTVIDGGGLSASSSFTLTVYSAPSTQASNILFSNIQENQITMTWTNGNGTKRAAFVKQGTGTITNPTDLVTYTPSSDWGIHGTELGVSGYYCVFNEAGKYSNVDRAFDGNRIYCSGF